MKDLALSLPIVHGVREDTTRICDYVPSRNAEWTGSMYYVPDCNSIEELDLYDSVHTSSYNPKHRAISVSNDLNHGLSNVDSKYALRAYRLNAEVLLPNADVSIESRLIDTGLNQYELRASSILADLPDTIVESMKAVDTHYLPLIQHTAYREDKVQEILNSFNLDLIRRNYEPSVRHNRAYASSYFMLGTYTVVADWIHVDLRAYMNWGELYQYLSEHVDIQHGIYIPKALNSVALDYFGRTYKLPGSLSGMDTSIGPI